MRSAMDAVVQAALIKGGQAGIDILDNNGISNVLA